MAPSWGGEGELLLTSVAWDSPVLKAPSPRAVYSQGSAALTLPLQTGMGIYGKKVCLSRELSWRWGGNTG